MGTQWRCKIVKWRSFRVFHFSLAHAKGRHAPPALSLWIVHHWILGTSATRRNVQGAGHEIYLTMCFFAFSYRIHETTHYSFSKWFWHILASVNDHLNFLTWNGLLLLRLVLRLLKQKMGWSKFQVSIIIPVANGIIVRLRKLSSSEPCIQRRRDENFMTLSCST